MKKINLRELYPDVYTTDFFVDVTEEVKGLGGAALNKQAERKITKEFSSLRACVY